ncbi:MULTISPECIES: hypothetical protein [Corynebacterium]|uniref:Secreted protein n=1 Tax=Corynebacterium aurimucosum TaxID=169292 RepID=A0A6I3KAZ9_9CORY|nr:MULTISPECIES: hypothetical protein [Corynebacterium]MTD91316.1 hypothetical protein [Corynebacterium aurimucosum]OFR66488.1 hypothetical protein HMPREF2875_08740 [Corynebacterium sp. HMSC078H07]
MVKKSARKVRLALVCGAVLALAAPSSAFAQDAEATLDGDTVPAADSESGFELSSGETKTVDLSDAKEKQSAEIHVEGEPTISFYDASNTAPACVSAEHHQAEIKIRNNCPTPVRVKVIMTGWVGSQDIECTGVAPGAEETVSKLKVPGITRIDRVENC